MTKRKPRSKPDASKTSQEPWKDVSSCSEAGLQVLAQGLAQELEPGSRVFLEGSLGAGKTTFARFLLQALSVSQPPEGSPTFAIAHEYYSKRGEVIHIDFYRLKTESEIDDAGLPAYFWERDAIVIAEWASQFPEFLKHAKESGKQAWELSLSFAPEPDRRNIKIWKV